MTLEHLISDRIDLWIRPCASRSLASAPYLETAGGDCCALSASQAEVDRSFHSCHPGGAVFEAEWQAVLPSVDRPQWGDGRTDPGPT